MLVKVCDVSCIQSNCDIHYSSDREHTSIDYSPHLMMEAPHESPAPKPAQAITSPFLTFPLLTAASSAMGIDAALVLP